MLLGLTYQLVLFVVDLVLVRSGISASPTGEWVAQQARNLAWKLEEGPVQAKFLLRDRDCKFTASFDQVFRSQGMEVLRLPYRAPRANSFAKRWVGTARRELLDHLLIFGRRHLDYVLSEFFEHYHKARPQQGLGQRTPSGEPPALVPAGRIVRRDRLGGLIHEYSRALTR
jgi:putative transposase